MMPLKWTYVPPKESGHYWFENLKSKRGKTVVLVEQPGGPSKFKFAQVATIGNEGWLPLFRASAFIRWSDKPIDGKPIKTDKREQCGVVSGIFNDMVSNIEALSPLCNNDIMSLSANAKTLAHLISIISEESCSAIWADGLPESFIESVKIGNPSPVFNDTELAMGKLFYQLAGGGVTWEEGDERLKFVPDSDDTFEVVVDGIMALSSLDDGEVKGLSPKAKILACYISQLSKDTYNCSWYNGMYSCVGRYAINDVLNQNAAGVGFGGGLFELEELKLATLLYNLAGGGVVWNKETKSLKFVPDAEAREYIKALDDRRENNA
ncbi:MAG: hypothetical protein GY928_33645 [Colwellia sp.]|nr:hypothetical protein [Colwellia sp.]